MLLPGLIEYLIHIDQNLPLVIQEYGLLTYLILFVIIFLETGLVVTPFLPGDSLLFVAGMVAARGFLDLWALLAVFIVAAIIGDTLNYWIGNYLGLKVFQKRFPNIIRKEYIDRTYGFFEQYGGKTIFIARFIPVVRTFAPFLAGIGSMTYRRFLTWNVLGAVAWSVSVVLAGYFLGTVPIIQDNLNLFIYGVIAVTAATIIFIVYLVVRGALSGREPEAE
ncbi:MAG: VTT domain-containing protein [Methanoregulaceae archaeon]|nr:VTT domain-containing protein [Methanoregulaceae archaeon]